jgi:predicted metal-binding membrane protein
VSQSATEQRFFVALLMALCLAAWLGLWLAGSSPYAGYVHNHGHHDHAVAGLDNSLSMAVVFIAGWLLMTIAMMLPTSIPLLHLFFRITRRRTDRQRLALLVISGYLSVWLVFGVLAYLGIQGLHQASERVRFLQTNAWMAGAATLIAAGLYQFSSLKYRCLDKCRSPLSFIAQHWKGRGEQRSALQLGAHHGIFCVGCCWALMLLMFPFGAGNVGWMLVLGTLMAIEKNVSWGRRFGRPLGVVLLGCGLIVVLINNPPAAMK